MSQEKQLPGDVTQVIEALARGDPRATNDLLDTVYEELRRLARARMADEPNAGAGMTLQATALVHEAYLRLVGSASSGPKWENRGHFFGAAALAMRRILVERARHQKRIKHGGGRQRFDVDDHDVLQSITDYDRTDLVALDEAIKKLEKVDPRKAKIVSLRYFAGLSIAETAAALDLSATTVKNEWLFARAWLHREIDGGEDEPKGESEEKK
jgi:RNA polymerase sigma factor (TIGR02999 family)